MVQQVHGNSRSERDERLNLPLIRHVVALVLLVTLADACLLAALVIKPFSEPLSWSIACWTAERFWGYMQQHWSSSLNAGPAVLVTGDPIPRNESAVVISNHQTYADYYLVQALSGPAGMLGRCRYFVKKEVVWQIPLFGWAFWALGMILVSRRWTNDAGLIERAFARVKRNEHGVWIVLYPEGTRKTSHKLLESQAFARRTGKHELEHLLQPRTKGFVATIQGQFGLKVALYPDLQLTQIIGLRNSHVRYLYDLTFLYVCPGKEARVPSYAEQLCRADLAAAGYEYHIHVRRVSTLGVSRRQRRERGDGNEWGLTKHRIAMSDLPQDEDALKEWCEAAWAEKDRRLEEMMRDAGVVG
ncbi:hypothetical protein JCM24511_04855 [Saitozyma sp. JCM 24511]|nr:hypothetical protein JCM24511_04855 [Saitozyma sp. JCM 24511]